MNETTNAIKERQTREKALLLENLQKIPIVHIACEKSSIGRATYYRWREEDSVFSKAADDALTEGEAFITDMSESRLITLIKEGKFPAVHLWLRHHHRKYKNTIEVTNRSVESDVLSPEQEATVQKALKLTKLDSSEIDHAKS